MENMFGGGRTFEILLMIIPMVAALFFSHKVIDYLLVIMMSFGVMFGFKNGECKLAKYRTVRYLSKLSFPIYLNHNMFRELAPYYFDKFSIICLIGYLILITIYSMITMYIVDNTVNFFERKIKK